jgi:predicted transcriptional regulator
MIENSESKFRILMEILKEATDETDREKISSTIKLDKHKLAMFIDFLKYKELITGDLEKKFTTTIRGKEFLRDFNEIERYYK